MRALSLPGCGCRVAFQFAVLQRLARRGERFDLVAGASSGSLAGAAYVSGRVDDGPAIVRAMGGTPVFSPRWLRSERSPFGMSAIIGDALRRYLPEEAVRESPTELFVATTPLRTLATHLVTRAGAPVVHAMRGRRDVHEVLLASCTFPPFYARMPRLGGEIHLDGGITDNALIGPLVLRGATEITVVTPHPDGSVYRALLRGFERVPLPSSVRLRVLRPRRKLRLRSFDFDPERLAEALSMDHVGDD